MESNNKLIGGIVLIGGLIGSYYYFNKKNKYEEAKDRGEQKKEILKNLNKETIPLESNQQPTQTGGDAMTPPTVIETGQPTIQPTIQETEFNPFYNRPLRKGKYVPESTLKY